MSQSSDHHMAEPPAAPTPTPTATNNANGSATMTKQPKASTPALSTTTAPAASAVTSAVPGPASSTSAAAVLTADDIKYKRKYRDLKKRIREIEEENDQLNLKLSRARKNIRRLRVERSFLFDKLDNVELPTVNDSLDQPSTSSSSSDSDHADESSSHRGSTKKRGSTQPPISGEHNGSAPARKPKGRPPGRRSAGAPSRRRGTAQEKEQQQQQSKTEKGQPQGHDEEEDQLDEDEYESRAPKDNQAHEDGMSVEHAHVQENAMSIDHSSVHLNAGVKLESEVKEDEAMAIDPKEVPPAELDDHFSTPVAIASEPAVQLKQQQEIGLGKGHEQELSGSQTGAPAVAGQVGDEQEQGQSQSQGASQLGSGQKLPTTPVQVHPLSPRIGHDQALPLRPPYQQPAWQHYDLPYRQPPDQHQSVQESPPLSLSLPQAHGPTRESTPLISAPPPTVSMPSTPPLSAQQPSPSSLKPFFPPRQSQWLYHQPTQPTHRPQEPTLHRTSHETSQSHFQQSPNLPSQHSPSPQESSPHLAFEHSQEVARRHSYEHAVYQHHQENNWAPPPPRSQHPLPPEPEYRNVQHRQSAPSVLQQSPHTLSTVSHSHTYPAFPHPPRAHSPHGSLDRQILTQRPAAHYHQQPEREYSPSAYQRHTQDSEHHHQQHNSKEQSPLYTGQQVRAHVHERTFESPPLAAPHRHVHPPLSSASHYGPQQLISSPNKDYDALRANVATTTSSPSLSMENNASNPSTPPLLPLSPTILRSLATTPISTPYPPIHPLTPNTPTSQQQQHLPPFQLPASSSSSTQQTVSESSNAKRFAPILPHAAPQGSMAPPPPPSLSSSRKRKSSGSLSVETSPISVMHHVSPISPLSLPTPGGSPFSGAGATMDSNNYKLSESSSDSSVDITPFGLFAKQHYKLAAAQPGVSTAEQTSQALQNMWQQLPEHHKMVYQTAVMRGDHSIADSMRTPQVGRPSIYGQQSASSSAQPSRHGSTASTDKADVYLGSASSIAQSSSSSSTVIPHPRKHKADANASNSEVVLTSSAAAAKGRTGPSDKKADTTVDGEEGPAILQAKGVGRGSAVVPQERAAVMTRRHNNAFFQFSMQHRKRLTRELRLPSHRITQILGNMWKELPESQKLEFEKMAYQEQQKIMREQNDYFKKHGLGIKNYDTIMFALSGPPPTASTDKKSSKGAADKDRAQQATSKAATTTSTAGEVPASEPPAAVSAITPPPPSSSAPSREEEAYHNVHRPNNMWDRQTQSGMIVFTEPLTGQKPREKKRLVSGGRSMTSVAERATALALATTSDGSTGGGGAAFMSPTHHHHQSFGPPPPPPGPASRRAKTSSSAAITGAPSSAPSLHNHSRGRALTTVDSAKIEYPQVEGQQHGEGESDEKGVAYNYSYTPSTPYYSSPCYIPPSPYPLEPSLLHDSGDDAEVVDRYGYGSRSNDHHGHQKQPHTVDEGDLNSPQQVSSAGHEPSDLAGHEVKYHPLSVAAAPPAHA